MTPTPFVLPFTAFGNKRIVWIVLYCGIARFALLLHASCFIFSGTRTLSHIETLNVRLELQGHTASKDSFGIPWAVNTYDQQRLT